jgi:sigma-B regulation protein RsbU (phosphoserine phosphatase)
LGIFHDSSYTSQETPFGVGDRILLYTDGIIEATGADDTLFEVDRLKSSLGASRSLSSKATVDNLLNDVAAFAGKETPADDRTLILISRIL